MYTNGILTGTQIAYEVSKGYIRISDFDPSKINPNSYNVSIGDTIYSYVGDEPLDPRDASTLQIKPTVMDEEVGYLLEFGKIYLIATKETISSDIFVPMITGRSSYGRIGLSTHQEAGFGDIGFSGKMTLQLSVSDKRGVIIYPNTELAQVYFMTTYGSNDILYKGKYNNAKDVIPSKAYDDVR